MNTIKTFIPSESVDAFKKFAEKTKRNVEGFDYTISNPRKKLFRHAVVEDCQTIIGKYWHDICDLTINMPDESNWRLLATYKNGAFTPADTTKELVFKIKEHGADYGKCDLCGHWCNNAYVIENTQTGDELQVGCECIKKFGLKYIGFLSDFTRKLYETYDHTIRYATDDDYGDLIPIWGGPKDSRYTDAILKNDMIAMCKAQYDECPVYKKGYYANGHYYPSETIAKLEEIRDSKKFTVDSSYITKVCDFALSKEPKSQFEVEMQKVANDYYTFSEQFVYAFFLVKNYEDSLKGGIDAIKKGMQVKVVGKVIQQRTEQSYYGEMVTNTILTKNGIVCERVGKIPTAQKDGEKTTEFYAIVKGLFNGKVCLDRATKNPKKGIEVAMEI